MALLSRPCPSYLRAPADPATGENEVRIVDDGGLAGGHGTLGNVEFNASAATGPGLNPRCCWFVLVPDLNPGADGRAGLINRNPVDIINFKRGCAQGFVSADDDAVLRSIDGQNVHRLTCGKTESLALADGVMVYTLVAANDRAIFRDDIAFLFV